MSKIFISYRKNDTIGSSGRIYDRLEEHFGQGVVFIDGVITGGQKSNEVSAK